MSLPLSPCNRICTIDDDCGLCIGCGRTLAEIAAWHSLDDNRRTAIMAALPARMSAAGFATYDGTEQETAR